jgi:GTPase SAR1 family protein
MYSFNATWAPPRKYPKTRLREDIEFHMSILGGGGVGKSTTAIQYAYNYFVEEYGKVSFLLFSYFQTLQLKTTSVKLSHFGQEMIKLQLTYLTLAMMNVIIVDFILIKKDYMGNAWMNRIQGFILMYSTTSISSFFEIREYYEQILKQTKRSASVVLVG